LKRRPIIPFLTSDRLNRRFVLGALAGLPAFFPQVLYDEAKKDGWTVISMKDDWKRIFSFD
jgi:hypothetical protein